MAKPSQLQMFYRASRYNAELDLDFLWHVNNGMTREDLEENIKRRPDLWKRWEDWLDKLPSRASPAPA
jgi:hypothetical protein